MMALATVARAAGRWLFLVGWIAGSIHGSSSVAAADTVEAAPTAPQVDEIFLPNLQQRFQADAGSVRIVLLLAPT